jgi:hypothetical protein
MKKLAPEPPARKSAAKKTAGANHRTSLPRRMRRGWRGALERNLQAEGYSADEARELVEIAAS